MTKYLESVTYDDDIMVHKQHNTIHDIFEGHGMGWDNGVGEGGLRGGV